MPRHNDKKFTNKRAVLTSFIVSLSDVILNSIVALVTGSAVILAEALQGFADLTSAGILLIGQKRASRKASKKHPFGFGKEIYFWTQISAFIILAITATFTFYFGYKNFRNPHEIENLTIAYAMLIFALCTNGYAFSISVRKILEGKKRKKLFSAFFASHHVDVKTTFILDLMGTIAAGIGLVAITLYSLTGIERIDGIGAMVISIFVAFLAFVLLISLKDLITGQSAPENIERKIRAVAREHPMVLDVLGLRTMIIGSDKILVTIDVHLDNNLTTDDIEEDIDEIKESIRRKVPTAHHIQVELETPVSELKSKPRQNRLRLRRRK